MNSKIKKMARAGYVAKGVVYGVTGLLTFMAAFNMGGTKTGQKGVFKFLEDQPFGNAILILMAIGLVCYSGWRFYQSIKDPENIGSHDKGKIKRIGFFISGLIYLGYAVYAIITLINAGSSGGGKTFSFLSGNFGIFVFAVIGLSLVGVCIFQIKKATSGKFLQKFNYKSITEEKRRKVIKNTGYLGIISRAVIFGVMAFVFLRAAYRSNTNDIKTTADAFSFLQDSAYGAWLMGLVAAGLVLYGIFMFMTAKYRRFQT
ncbi:MAG: DUF1206 domain-containing protein [Bacteroidota bacterium]|uniref:Uncharacterized protein n=1 Tax=Christiangramia flava JLT2011 TaxID=1229726 RepID=A0A1L7IA04_9FLAO|nr:DUF1206 domain-containing protein [Christiangramia flava]APU69935.1 hypothetical protein GRFL_3211 [Christiangramia flava JLT2011]MEE2771836.1 DUF1206 domain-containing protein [Bacteroidota bacterium]OSS39420.1 hypothetical protein C723_1322 [Christiangramia flava JLT2011]